MPKKNSNKKQYTREFKEAILKRLQPPSNESVSMLSKELNISKSTIYQWVRISTKKNNQIIIPGKNKSSIKWTTEDKFHIVLETYSLTEEELAEYCRKKGLYVDEIKSWRNQCINANLTTSKDPQITEDELKEERQKTKTLEKELRYKEKALAETAALLVLKKKAQAIWGDPEDE